MVFFWGDTWTETANSHSNKTKVKQLSDEIALNPDSFASRGLEKVLSTLVHEMCHFQQYHFGKPSRSGYHNKQWVQMMENVGLIPSDTGEEGAKQTGQNMAHYIKPDGAYQQAFNELAAEGFSIPWQALTRDEEKAAKKRASKTKYTCSTCGVNAWAKPNTNLKCGDCDQLLEE